LGPATFLCNAFFLGFNPATIRLGPFHDSEGLFELNEFDHDRLSK
jgi:hypothetical protein